MKFRKKPVVIDAVRWNGQNGIEIQCFIKDGSWHWTVEDSQEELYIETLEGKMKANVGDYIIKGVNGEFYPCKEDIFNKTYEPVSLEETKQTILEEINGSPADNPSIKVRIQLDGMVKFKDDVAEATAITELLEKTLDRLRNKVDGLSLGVSINKQENAE